MPNAFTQRRSDVCFIIEVKSSRTSGAQLKKRKRFIIDQITLDLTAETESQQCEKRKCLFSDTFFIFHLYTQNHWKTTVTLIQNRYTKHGFYCEEKYSNSYYYSTANITILSSYFTADYFIFELITGLFPVFSDIRWHSNSLLFSPAVPRVARDKTQAERRDSCSPSSSVPELDVKQEAGWRGTFGEQALSNLLWSGFICRSMWIKPFTCGQISSHSSSFYSSNEPPAASQIQ